MTIDVNLYNDFKVLAQDLNIEDEYDWDIQKLTNEILMKNILEIKEKYGL